MNNIKFVNKKDGENNDYFCAICKDFLCPDKTMQLDCCHLFCNECLEKNYGELSLYSDTNCPLCNSRSKPKYIKKCNRFAFNILSDIKIYCPNEDCNKEITIGDFDNHISKCDYQILDCPYCDKEQILRKELNNHLKNNMEDHFLILINEVEKLKKIVNSK